MSRRGDIVVVEIPYFDRPGAKERPAVVVQCDRNNTKLMSSVVAGVTTNLQRVATEPTQFLIDPTTPDGAASGLSAPSAVKCENLYTISQQRIIKTLGHLSDPLLSKLEKALKASLDIA